MTRFVAALALAGVLTAAPALAADKAGAPAIIPDLTPVASKASCYISALAGGSVVSSKPDGAVLPASLSAESWSVAAGLGCDVKLDKVVIGALARIEAPVDTSGSLVDLDKSWMVALRAGYMLSTGVMPYGLVGYQSSDFSIAGIDLKRDGLVVGGGLEIPLSANLRLIGEYNYIGLGKTDIAGLPLDTQEHKFRLGLSYQFNSLIGD
jgi:opacity protein-like surface antigen